jgi:hypothetical protein
MSFLSESSEKYFYESLFQKWDTRNEGFLTGNFLAAKFKLSGLPKNTLAIIWDLADSDKEGKLNKTRFFVALKLIALAQQGKALDLSNLNLKVPLPTFKGLNDTSAEGFNQDQRPKKFNITSEEKSHSYDLFYKATRGGEKLSGAQFKQMTSNSGLSNVTLAEIWEHSDTNKNGYLNADEFVTASHLIRLAKAGRPPPSSSSRSYRTSSLSLHQQKRNEPLTLLRSTEMSFEEIEKQIKNLSEAEKELKKEIANRESELEHLLLEVRDLEKEETEVQSR